MSKQQVEFFVCSLIKLISKNDITFYANWFLAKVLDKYSNVFPFTVNFPFNLPSFYALISMFVLTLNQKKSNQPLQVNWNNVLFVFFW